MPSPSISKLNEYLMLVDVMRSQSARYTHAPFCNGTCGGQCNQLANHPKPPQLPTAPPQLPTAPPTVPPPRLFGQQQQQQPQQRHLQQQQLVEL
jgi:hypothetical protein